MGPHGVRGPSAVLRALRALRCSRLASISFLSLRCLAVSLTRVGSPAGLSLTGVGSPTGHGDSPAGHGDSPTTGHGTAPFGHDRAQTQPSESFCTLCVCACRACAGTLRSAASAKRGFMEMPYWAKYAEIIGGRRPGAGDIVLSPPTILELRWQAIASQSAFRPLHGVYLLSQSSQHRSGECSQWAPRRLCHRRASRSAPIPMARALRARAPAASLIAASRSAFRARRRGRCAPCAAQGSRWLPSPPRATRSAPMAWARCAPGRLRQPGRGLALRARRRWRGRACRRRATKRSPRPRHLAGPGVDAATASEPRHAWGPVEDVTARREPHRTAQVRRSSDQRTACGANHLVEGGKLCTSTKQAGCLIPDLLDLRVHERLGWL